MKQLHVLKNSNVLKLWIGSLGSGFGTWVFNIALLLFIADINMSGGLISGLMISTMIPYIVFGPRAGQIIDRKKKKTVLILSDILRFVFILILIPVVNMQAALSNGFIVIVIYIINFLSATAGVFFSPARKCVIPLISEKDQIQSVNSLMAMLGSVTLVLGPAVGGILTLVLGIQGVFLLNAVSYIVSALLIFFMKFDEDKDLSTATNKEKKKFFEGLYAINNQPDIQFYVYSAVIRAVLIGVMNISFIFIASAVFSNGKDSVSLLYSALGLGLIIGSMLIGNIKWKNNGRRLYLIVVCSNAFFSLFYASSQLWIVVLVSLFIIGISDGFQMVILNTSIQNQFRKNQLGVIFSTSDAFTMCAQLFSLCIGGILIDIYNPRVIITLASILTISSTLILYFYTNKSEKLTGEQFNE